MEPNEEMREASAQLLKNYLRFKSIDGTAKDTKLGDNSIDFVIAARVSH
ncbi:MAG TPA: hypothetical protein VEC36_00430 [Patescibacteria group bacterium]|nr:hypothetical protein [Patescibacteria group bacterium]